MSKTCSSGTLADILSWVRKRTESTMAECHGWKAPRKVPDLCSKNGFSRVFSYLASALLFILPYLNTSPPPAFFFKRETKREADRESQAGSTLLVQSPTWGSISQTWDHDLSQNQEPDAQLTEPPRRPSKVTSWCTVSHPDILQREPSLTWTNA